MVAEEEDVRFLGETAPRHREVPSVEGQAGSRKRKPARSSVGRGRGRGRGRGAAVVERERLTGDPVLDTSVPEQPDRESRGDAMADLLRRCTEEAEDLGLRFKPHYPAAAVEEQDKGRDVAVRKRGPGRELPKSDWVWPTFWVNDVPIRPTRSQVSREGFVGGEFVRKYAYWPFCTRRGTDPFSPTGPYPRGLERWLAYNVPPKVVLELDALPGYRDHRNEQRITTCWKFLFDYYPWFLPREISRYPYFEDRPAELRSVPLEGDE